MAPDSTSQSTTSWDEPKPADPAPVEEAPPATGSDFLNDPAPEAKTVEVSVDVNPEVKGDSEEPPVVPANEILAVAQKEALAEAERAVAPEPPAENESVEDRVTALERRLQA